MTKNWVGLGEMCQAEQRERTAENLKKNMILKYLIYFFICTKEDWKPAGLQK